MPLAKLRAAGPDLLMALAVSCGCMGCGARTEGSQIVARVNREEISVHQVNFMMQKMPGVRPEQADSAGRAVLGRLIEQELAVQGALEAKLDRNPQVMQALAAARREVLASAWMQSVAERTTSPDGARVAAYYDDHPSLFAERRLYHLVEIVIQAAPTEIENLRGQLKSANSLDQVFARLRAAGLAAKTNETTLAAESLPPMLEQIPKLRDGQAIMLTAPGGARIVCRVASQSAPLTLDAARASIERALLAEDRQVAVRRALDDRRRTADVRYLGSFATAAGVSPPAARAASTAPRDQAPAASAASPSAGVDADSVRRGLKGL